MSSIKTVHCYITLLVFVFVPDHFFVYSCLYVLSKSATNIDFCDFIFDLFQSDHETLICALFKEEHRQAK